MDQPQETTTCPSNSTTPHTRRCTKCGEEKDLADFRQQWGYRDGRRHECRSCTNTASRLVGAFRRSPAYAAMVAKQDGRCACCGSAGPLQIDHDHETGEVRELICRACNVALGQSGDTPSGVMNLVRYHARHGKALSTEQLAEFLDLYHPAHMET